MRVTRKKLHSLHWHLKSLCSGNGKWLNGLIAFKHSSHIDANKGSISVHADNKAVIISIDTEGKEKNRAIIFVVTAKLPRKRKPMKACLIQTLRGPYTTQNNFIGQIFMKFDAYNYNAGWTHVLFLIFHLEIVYFRNSNFRIFLRN